MEVQEILFHFIFNKLQQNTPILFLRDQMQTNTKRQPATTFAMSSVQNRSRHKPCTNNKYQQTFTQTSYASPCKATQTLAISRTASFTCVICHYLRLSTNIVKQNFIHFFFLQILLNLTKWSTSSPLSTKCSFWEKKINYILRSENVL